MSVTAFQLNEGNAEESGGLEIIRWRVASLRFGIVQIVVDDSRATQIEKTERVRLEKSRRQN